MPSLNLHYFDTNLPGLDLTNKEKLRKDLDCIDLAQSHDSKDETFQLKLNPETKTPATLRIP